MKELGPETIRARERQELERMRERLEGSAWELYTGPGQAGVLSLRHPRLDCETAARLLGERGICVRSGLHCAPLAHESAGTLATGTVRLSFSPFLSAGELAQGCSVLLEESEKTKRN